jgi:cytochrome P450
MHGNAARRQGAARQKLVAFCAVVTNRTALAIDVDCTTTHPGRPPPPIDVASMRAARRGGAVETHRNSLETFAGRVELVRRDATIPVVAAARGAYGAAVHALPPGSRLPAIVQVLRWLRTPIPMYEASRRRWGDVFTIRFPANRPIVLFGDPEAVRTIFTGDPEQLRAGESNVILEPFVGTQSVLTTDGARHKRKRRLLMPPFHGDRMRVYGEVMAALTEAVVAAWPVGRPFPIHPEMQRVTLEVILRTVFGLDEGPALTRLRDCIVEGAAIVTANPLLMIQPLQRDLGPLTGWGRALRLRAEADTILYGEFARRRAEGPGSRQDILTMLLEARDESGQPMDDAELRDEMLTLLLAGHETTATTLAWVLYFVLQHPHVLARLHAEIAAVGGGGPVPAERVGELAYLDATIKEAQRLMPIIPMVGRVLRDPMEIGGWRLPAGVVAAPGIYLVHHRADLWPEPDRFLPERFLDARQSPYEFFPFGGGVRHCLGAAFAAYEMKIVLSTMLARVELRAAPGYRARVARRGIAFSPSDGMPLIVERRAA